MAKEEGRSGEGDSLRGKKKGRRRKSESEIREEGWANRANGQVAYLWRPYFRYMNWFPSKVRDAASFQFKMYREVSRRSPSNGKICEGSPFSRALSYELNSVFLLSCEANAGHSTPLPVLWRNDGTAKRREYLITVTPHLSRQSSCTVT